MLNRLSIPFRVVLTACALAVAGMLAGACVDHAGPTAPRLRANRLSPPRVVLLRPVLQDGRTADVPPRVLVLQAVPSR